MTATWTHRTSQEWRGRRSVAILSLCAVWALLARSSKASTCHLDSEAARHRRFQAIKTQILSKLGMTEPPDPSLGPAVAPPQAIASYQAALMRRKRRSLDELDGAGEQHNYYGKRVTLQPVQGAVGRFHGDRVSFSINIDDLRARLAENLTDIYQADLQLRYQPLRNGQQHLDKDGTDRVRLEVSEVTARVANKSVRFVYMDGAKLDLRRVTPLSFDVTEAVRRWLDAPQEGRHDKSLAGELELTVHCSHKDDATILKRLIGGLAEPLSHGHDWRAVAADLLVLSHSPSEVARQHRRRAKRQLLSHQFCLDPERAASKTCCLRQLYVNFQRDLHWNWILQPQGYFANHCSGKCPYMWAEETAHATVLGLYHSLNPTASAQPCCVAKDLDSMTILYKDKKGTPLVEELSQMVVVSCKCR